MIEKRLLFPLLATLFIAGCPTAPRAAETIQAVSRGTDGLVRIPFGAHNVGADPIACMVETAHFFAVDLGVAAPGGTVRRDLWAAVATGDVFVLNDAQDRMPVQALWCGLAGRAWVTRSTVVLERRARRVPDAIALDCRGEAAGLQCR